MRLSGIFYIFIILCLNIQVLNGGMIRQAGQYSQAIAANAILIYPEELTTNTYVIDQPGIYLLVSDIIFTPTVPQPAFHISASGVQLDLNKRLLGQYTTTSDCVGIVVDSDVSGLQIRNGSVFGVTGTGIVMNSGDQFFIIEDLNFHDCTHCILDFEGTSTTAPVISGIVNNITMTHCSTGTETKSVIYGNYANNIMFQNVLINQCGLQSDSLSAIFFANSIDTQFQNFNVVGCQALTQMIGFNFSACKDLIVNVASLASNCEEGVTGNFTAFLATNTTITCIFDACDVVDNGNENIAFIGADVQDYCTGNIFFNLKLIDNEGSSVVGVSFSGTGSPSNNNNNIISESYIVGNEAHAGDCTAVLINTSDKGTLEDTKIAANDSFTGVATGVLFQTGNGGSLWGVRNCEILKNQGNSDANSYGINMLSGINNLFMQNVAYHNGNIPANQLNGLAAGSVTLATPITLNSITSPWTNVGATS